MVIPDLSQFFTQAGVHFAYLFGSRARGQERPDSDFDIAVWFPVELDALARFKRGCDLQARLEQALSGKVDLIILNDAKPVLQNEAVLRGLALYPQNKEAIIRFEARLRQRYEDYAYSQRYFTEARKKRMDKHDAAS